MSADSNASGNTVIGPDSVIVNYTMGNPNGALVSGSPIDFLEAERYLTCASGFWGALPASTSGEVVFGQLNPQGADETLNVFTFDSTNIYGTGQALNQLNGINIIAPLSSTILINVTSPAIQFGSYQIFRNGITATRTNARRILWNFPDALTWSNSTTAIYGSVLAPFADASTTFSQINGNIVFSSFIGNAESHNELFEGELPEPTVCLLSTSTTTTDSTTTNSTTTDSTTTASTTTDSTTTASTTTDSTTTATTTAVPTPNPRSQAISNLVASVALQQAALSHILNAEGEKLQRVIGDDFSTPEALLATNKSVESMVKAVTNLEVTLIQKLEKFRSSFGEGL